MLACLARVGAAAIVTGRDRSLPETRMANLSGRLNVDQLTGLMNRSAFHAVLDDARLAEHEMLIVLFFDLDRFKEVNDTLGHKVGDDLLRQVAERACRSPASRSRCPPGRRRIRRDHRLGQRLRPKTMARRWFTRSASPFYHRHAGGDRRLGRSGRRRSFPRCTGSELLRRADLAMYTVKGAPKGGFRMFDDALDPHEMRESSVRVELGKAMVEDLFSLHFQPLVDARTGRLSSAEALLRSHAPALRDVSPHAMILTAESSGQITRLPTGLRARSRRGSEAGNRPHRGQHLADLFPPARIRVAADGQAPDARIRPEQLIVEITENVLIENVDAARRSIERLREMGIEVFLDDFGTGYSSLSYLQNFELDGLKLDKSFLRSVGDRRKTNQIIRSVIDFGHGLDMRVVVEGVESDWQVRLLQLLGCDLLQGSRSACR